MPAGNAARKRRSHSSSCGCGGAFSKIRSTQARAPHGALRGGDVHDDCGFSAIRIGINAADDVIALAIIDQQDKVVAGFAPQAGSYPDAGGSAEATQRSVCGSRRIAASVHKSTRAASFL